MRGFRTHYSIVLLLAWLLEHEDIEYEYERSLLWLRRRRVRSDGQECPFYGGQELRSLIVKPAV